MLRPYLEQAGIDLPTRQSMSANCRVSWNLAKSRPLSSSWPTSLFSRDPIRFLSDQFVHVCLNGQSGGRKALQRVGGQATLFQLLLNRFIIQSSVRGPGNMSLEITCNIAITHTEPGSIWLVQVFGAHWRYTLLTLLKMVCVVCQTTLINYDNTLV